MNEEMLNLKPAKVFYYFNEITKIPRPSKKETLISEQGECDPCHLPIPYGYGVRKE